MIVIDKGIPIPAGNSGAHGKYPFASMVVGDSFFVTDDLAKLKRAAYGWGKRHGVKFRLEALTEGGEEGVRVWRVE